MLRLPPISALFPYTTLFRSCRNLLMYLARQVASALVDRMTGALAPGGYLFLGHTDSLGRDRKSTRLNSSHPSILYAVLCFNNKLTTHVYLSCALISGHLTMM